MKLRSGCVGRTQAVGMVRLGASSAEPCSDPATDPAADGIIVCCCPAMGVGPSVDMAAERQRLPVKDANIHREQQQQLANKDIHSHLNETIMLQGNIKGIVTL